MTQANMIPLRRRILYIRHRRSIEIADGFRMNQDEWVEALSALADVTLKDHDFDLDEVCDRVRPDFILYESPFFCPAPLTIQNVNAHPQIPRIGFQMQDVSCTTRVNFLRTMEAMNIQWMFSHMTEAALRQSPELKYCTFSVSLLFDDRVFYDYGLEKDIPVSVFGGFLMPQLYDWRAKTALPIAERFPTLIYTHPGYNNPVPRNKFQVTGEDYARLLNRSHFSLADTTIFDCLVRKHLEIPASGAVLVAPEASVLKPYGFKDMENCILGAGNELFDKITAVADDPALYEKIRKNGHDLVHSRYSRKNWRGILDFYECLRTLKAGETIRQQGILGPFEIVPSRDACTLAIVADYIESPISSVLHEWMNVILSDEGLNAENAKRLTAPAWLSDFQEPSILAGIVALLKGDVPNAEKLFSTLQIQRREQSGFVDYDPEEVAWISLTAALSGNAALLKITKEQSVGMRHLSLRRMEWLGKILATGGNASNPPPTLLRRIPNDQISIHWTGQLDLQVWLKLIGRILKANGQASVLKI